MAAVSDVPDVAWKKMAVGTRHCLYLRLAFHLEKTRSKPLDRAIYTIFYRYINRLR